jgi:HEAT repeat protein
MDQALNALLNSLKDLPLKSAYDQACFLLHCADRGWLSSAQLKQLIKAFHRFDVNLSVGEQIQNCERLVQLAQDNHLVDSENQLRSQLITLKRDQNKLFEPMPAFIGPDPQRYFMKHADVLDECVRQRQRQQETNVSDDLKQQNMQDTHRVEAEIWFDLVMPLLLSRLRDMLQTSPDAVIVVLTNLANLAERLAAEGLYDKARVIYQDMRKALQDNARVISQTKHLVGSGSEVEDDRKSCLNQIDERFLVFLLAKISQAECGEQAIDRNKVFLKPQWPLSVAEFANLRQRTTAKSCTADIQRFVGNLFTTLTHLLGPAPCAYAVIGMGSFGRGDMTPYSDLETLIVIKELAYKDYFKSMYKLLECQIRMLGESFENSLGFHLDGESNPARDQTEEHIVLPTYYTLEKVVVKQDGELNRFRYTLLTAKLLYGNSDIFQLFQATLKDAANSNSTSKLADFGQAWLQDHLNDFDKFQKPPVTAEVNLKEDYLKWLTYLLTDLSICLNLNKSNLIEIINALPLADYFKLVCVKTLNELQVRRFELHRQARQAKNNLPRNRQLDLIFQGVIEPLYANAKLLAAARAQNAPLVDPLGILTAQLANQDDKIRKQSLTTCASFLCYSNDSEQTIQIYQSLPVAYRGTFFSLLVENGVSIAVQVALRYQPNPDGWYPAMDEEKENWLKTFRTLFQTNLTPDLVKAAKQKNTVVIRCANLRGGQGISEYFLHDVVRAQLFESNGQLKLKPRTQRGRHTVLKITHLGQSFWLKFTPEQAGTEYAVNRLARHIGDHGTPMTQVIKLCQGNQTEGIVVQVTPHIEGLTLEETLQKYPERLRQLNSSSFTETLLRVLFTNPEDDKGDDYFLIPDDNQTESFHLIRIDNERAFYDPTEMKGALRKNEALQVKSMLYCLPQMQEALSDSVLDKFLQLDPILVLQRWLNELQLEHQRHQGLFTDKDVETHFAIKEPGPCLLGIPIAEGLVEELLARIDSMQQVIRLARDQGGKVIGMDLLKVVQPTLADYYADAFKAFADLTPQASLDRFEQVTKGLYQRSKQGVRESRIQSAKAITQSLRLKTKLSTDVVLQMVRGKQNSPVQGLETLQHLQSKKLEDVKQGLLSDNPKVSKSAISQFQNLAVRQRLQLFKELVEHHLHQPLDSNQQIILLQAIAGIPFHELSLLAFHEVLTDKILQLILESAGAHLIKLDLRGCVLLTDITIQRIVEFCPNLTYLGLEATNKMRVIKGIFPKLAALNVSFCAHLASIEIDSLQLSLLKAEGCPELKLIKTNSLLLREVDLADCVSLEEAGITELSKFAGHIRKVKLERSPITQQGFRTKYPFLVMLPLEHCSDVFVKRLDEQLQEAYKERFGESEKLPVLLDSRSAYQLFEKLKQRFKLAEELLKIADKLFLSNKKSYAVSILGYIASIGYKPERSVALFISLINGADHTAKMHAIQAAGAAAFHTALPTEIITILNSLLKDPQPSIREAVTLALGQATRHKFSEVIAVLLPRLEGLEDAATWDLSENLVKIFKQAAIHKPKEVIAVFLRLLKDPEWTVKEVAAKALGNAAYHNPNEVIAVLGPYIRANTAAITAIGQAALYAPLPTEIITALISIMLDTSKSSTTRATAAIAIGQAATITALPVDVIIALFQLLKLGEEKDHALKGSDSYALREAVIRALGQAVKPFPLHIDNLIAMLSPLLKVDLNIKSAAVIAAYTQVVTYKSPEFIGALPLMRGYDRDMREAAAKAVGQVATQVELPTEVLLALLDLLTESDDGVREAAAETVSQAVKHNPTKILSTLLQLLKDPEWRMRRAAAEAVSQVATQVKLSEQAWPEIEVFAALIRLLKDSEWLVRRAAAKAVGQEAMKVKLSAEVLSALLPLLKDSDWHVKEAAVKAMCQAATQLKLPPEVMSALLLLLKDLEWPVRKAAVQAVAQAAKHNPTEVLLALLPLLKDSSEDVRIATADVLGCCISENTFKNDIQTFLYEAENFSENNLSLRDSTSNRQADNQSSSRSSSSASNASFWNQNSSVTSTSSSATSSSSSSASTSTSSTSGEFVIKK